MPRNLLGNGGAQAAQELPRNLLAPRGHDLPENLLSQPGAPISQEQAQGVPTQGVPQEGAPAAQIPGDDHPKGPTTGDKIMSYALGIPQGVAEHVGAIAQLGDDGINHLFGTNFQSPHPSVFVGKAAKLEKLPAAQYGKLSGQILTDGLLGGGLGSLVAEAPLLARMATYFGAGAATQPGGAKKRLATGVATGLMGGASDYMFSILKHLPSYLHDSSLAKHIFKAYKVQKNTAKKMYDAVFKRIGSHSAAIEEEAQTAFRDLRAIKKGNVKIEDAIKTYNRNPTIRGLHQLRSDVGKEQSYLKTKGSLGRLSSTERDRLSHINKAKDSLDRSIEKQISSIDPVQHEQYINAQHHWKHNVVPFREFNSVKKLIKNGEVTGTLRSNLAKKYISDKLFPQGALQDAKRLRELTGLLRKPLESIPKLKRLAAKSATYGTLGYLLGKRIEGE